MGRIALEAALHCACAALLSCILCCSWRLFPKQMVSRHELILVVLNLICAGLSLTLSSCYSFALLLPFGVYHLLPPLSDVNPPLHSVLVDPLASGGHPPFFRWRPPSGGSPRSSPPPSVVVVVRRGPSSVGLPSTPFLPFGGGSPSNPLMVYFCTCSCWILSLARSCFFLQGLMLS